MVNGSLFQASPQLISAARIPSEERPWPSSEQTFAHILVFVLEEGQGEFVIGGRKNTVQGGSLIVVNPGESFGIGFSTPHPLKGFELRFSGMHLAGKPLERLILPGEPSVYRIHKERNEILKYLYEIIDEYHSRKFGYQDMLASLLQKMIILFLRSIENQKSDAAPSIPQAIKNHIETHYTEDLTLSDLANVVYVSPYYLAHIFKEEVGIPPIQYLILRRVEEAKKLLVQTDLSVIEIASLVGYENANYFNLIFKKMAGVAPGKYRKQQGV
jgi:AraC-like DNA-binding protein